MYQTSGSPACTGPSSAPSCAKRPSAVRLRGVELGSNGSISTTQPKVFDAVAIVVAAVRGRAELLGIPAAIEIVGRVRRDGGPQLAAGACDAVAGERGQFLRVRFGLSAAVSGGSNRRSSLRRSDTRPGWRYLRSVDWDYQQRSRYNRRIHTLTDIKMSGPAAGTPVHGHEVFAEWPPHARHGQQLRQRLHALGHVPHLRRKLRRLLPPRGRRRQSEAHRRRNWPRSRATASRAMAASCGPR